MKTVISFMCLAITVVFLSGLNDGVATQNKNEVKSCQIIPKPRILKPDNKMVSIAKKGGELTVSVSKIENESTKQVNSGLNLLTKRWMLLGGARVSVIGLSGKPDMVVEQCNKKEMLEIFRKEGVKEKPDEKRLSQAYFLQVTNNKEGIAVKLKTYGNMGLYYGISSLCQILDRDETGIIVAPAVKIVDWPETGLRLAKTSATANPLSRLNRFTNWMPLYKINLIGLQFHGEESKETDLFKKNVKSICAAQNQSGILETVVYFCPFRGKGYDFEKATDRDEYLTFIDWVFDQGARGFEVDYNDWPDTDVPIEYVLNLANNEVERVKPEAYVLYCPPNAGPAQYRGKVTPEMTRTLSGISKNVWPLWTGMKTLITDSLKPESVEEWTQMAGRRPFFWINRASIGVDKSFSRSLTGFPEARVVPGELLPKELNSLFEGIHLNFVFSEGNRHTLPEKVSVEELVYFATLADYLWNPNDWVDFDSYQRAKHFVEIMQPLITWE